MNKKQKLQKNKKQAAAKAVAIPGAGSAYPWLMPLLVLLVTFIAFLPVLKNGFVNWDDQAYIQENQMIRSFNLEEIFSTYQLGNYHPVTMFMYAVCYKLFGITPGGYHFVSILIHLLNTLLVYRFIRLLVPERIVALIVMALFGIHPIHVESVAWASELKDLLYTFFFLASSICYLQYLKVQKQKYFFYALLLFLLSLLSKAMAASLPAVLILIDFFKGRKFTAKVWLEKLPFFVLAVIFGVVAIKAQQSGNAITSGFYPLEQRAVFASYGFTLYLVKLLFPLELCAYYPYPIHAGEPLPVWYYSFVLLLAGMTGFLMYTLKKTRKLFFGLSYFALTVFLVLQLLPVGGAVMADRYCYIPSIGIFYLAAEGLLLLGKNKNRKNILGTPAKIILSGFVIFFFLKTWSQSSVWKSGMTLWNDVIRQYQTVHTAYYNRGVLLQNENRNEEALIDYAKAIELKPDYGKAYLNRGILFQGENKPDAAEQEYSKAIEVKAEIPEAFNNRGVILQNKGKLMEAMNDYNKAIELNPDYSNAFLNRGNALKEQKKYAEAISDFDKVIELTPDNHLAFNNRGIVNHLMNKNAEAIQDYAKAIEIKPDYTKAYLNRGNLFMDEKKYKEAIADYSSALNIEPGNAGILYRRGIAEYTISNKENACRDFQQAGKLGYPPAAEAHRLYCEFKK